MLLANKTVAEEIGYSRTSGIKWANGSIPRKATLKKIADYFSVTIDNLLSDNEKTAPLAGAGMTKAQQELIKLISSLSDQRELSCLPPAPLRPFLPEASAY